jgi:hypothetical protein
VDTGLRYVLVSLHFLFVYSCQSNDRATNLDLCFALKAFSSEGSFSCHTYCDTGPQFTWSHPKEQHPRPTVGFEPGKQG